MRKRFCCGGKCANIVRDGCAKANRVMRSTLLAGCMAASCAVFGWAGQAAAVELSTSIDLNYTYSQEDVGGDVDATTQFDQKYEVKYATSLTTAHDFLAAVKLGLQDSWYTDQASSSQISPTLEMQVKGSQLAAKLSYETKVSSTDTYQETGEDSSYSSSLSFDLEMTPPLWPEVKLKVQRRREFQEVATDKVTNSFEFSARKDIYALRLEYNIRREDLDASMPIQEGSSETKWSAKAAYKEILWGGTEFELAYEINESYKDQDTRGVFTGETTSYNQNFKTKVKNTLNITPRMNIALLWEYQFEQDLTSLTFDYKVSNKYSLDLHWDAYETLKITSAARRETQHLAAIEGEDDEQGVSDSFNAAFDLTTIPWLRVSGKADFKNESKIAALSGGSPSKTEGEKYELIVKNKFGEFWDFTWDASTSTDHVDDVLTNRETRVKGELKLKLLELDVTPGYQVSRRNSYDRLFEFPITQEHSREAKIRIGYQMQLAGLLKATFSHDYTIRVDDTLDEVLNFDRDLKFNESTQLALVMAELIRNVNLEANVTRSASDTEDDPDPQLVELSYALKLEWKLERLSLQSNLKYNDKGTTFDDLSFNAKASWRYEQLELTGEYQFDKIIKESTDPKDEKRKLGLKLSYRF